VSEPILDYDRLRGRVREVSSDVRAHSGRRERIDELGVTVHEQFSARFSDPQTRSEEREEPAAVALVVVLFDPCGAPRHLGHSTSKIRTRRLISLHAFGVGPHPFQFFDNRNRE
jgi:hypothetical protein